MTRPADAGREDWDTGRFRQWAAAQLDRHGGQFPAAARQAVVSASGYYRADVADVPSVANGNAALSIPGDEAEEAWRVVAPVLSAWSKDLVPLLEYPAGSTGPGAAAGTSP